MTDQIIKIESPYATPASKQIDAFVTGLRDADGDAFSEKGIEKAASLVGIAPSYWDMKRKAVTPEGRDGAKSKSRDAEQSRYSLLDVAEPPFNLKKLAALVEKSVPHAAAVNAKVSNITELGWDLVETDVTKDALADKTEAQKKKTIKKIKKAKQDAKKWIEGLSKTDDIQETLTKVITDYYVTGNGYVEIGRTSTGAIGYVGHIPAVSMRVRANRDGFVQLADEKLTYFRNFGAKNPNPYGNDPNPNEIIHIKKYSSLSGYYGIPEVVSALPAIAGTEEAIKYNLDYFSNKATPRYVIVIKGGNLSTSSTKSLYEFFETGVKGTNHRSIIVPLPADTKENPVTFEMKPIEAGIQEASFTKYIAANDATILMAHSTPPSKVASSSGSGLAAARDADKTFKEQVTRPMQGRIENGIMKKIISSYTDMFDFKLNELSLTDEDTKSKIYERLVRNQILMPNEPRVEMGYAAYDGGDEPLKLGAQANAEATAQTKQSRTRDAERSAGATDSSGEGRSAQGDGRTTD